MTENSPLVTPKPDARPAPARSRLPLLIGVVVIVLAAIVAGAAWYFLGRQTAPDWDRTTEIALAAPAGDPFDEETPWATLRLAPARPGEENSLTFGVQFSGGTPVAGENDARILGASVAPVVGQPAPEELALQATGEPTGTLTATSPLDQAGWWQIRVDIESAGNPATARFYLMVPDPNINGPGAVPGLSSSAEGEALYQQGLNALTSLQSVRYTQWLADGRGNAGFSDHAVTTGGDGMPAGFIYRAPGGMEAIVIESTRWVRLPNDFGWTKQEGAASVPPSEWGDEYTGATGFTILGDEEIDGSPARILAFVVPEITEPRRQTAAWYLWWVDTETGNILQQAMVSRVHYMLDDFSDFDVPIVLTPPEMSATPAAGTPAP